VQLRGNISKSASTDSSTRRPPAAILTTLIRNSKTLGLTRASHGWAPTLAVAHFTDSQTKKVYTRNLAERLLMILVDIRLIKETSGRITPLPGDSHAFHVRYVDAQLPHDLFPEVLERVPSRKCIPISKRTPQCSQAEMGVRTFLLPMLSQHRKRKVEPSRFAGRTSSLVIVCRHSAMAVADVLAAGDSPLSNNTRAAGISAITRFNGCEPHSQGIGRSLSTRTCRSLLFVRNLVV